jgi:hypothetical protein
MEKIIQINSVADVEDVYKNAKVSQTRIDGLNDKFQTVPDEFTVYGLVFPTLKIGKQTVPNVPAFAINEDGTKYVPVGTFKQSYTDKTTASQITKEGDNKDKWLVVNNKRVHALSEGLSEAEIVAYVQGKTFKASKAKEFQVFQPAYGDDRKPIYADTPEEALKMVKPKSFRIITEKQ